MAAGCPQHGGGSAPIDGEARSNNGTGTIAGLSVGRIPITVSTAKDTGGGGGGEGVIGREALCMLDSAVPRRGLIINVLRKRNVETDDT